MARRQHQIGSNEHTGARVVFTNHDGNDGRIVTTTDRTMHNFACLYINIRLIQWCPEGRPACHRENPADQ